MKKSPEPWEHPLHVSVDGWCVYSSVRRSVVVVVVVVVLVLVELVRQLVEHRLVEVLPVLEVLRLLEVLRRLEVLLRDGPS